VLSFGRNATALINVFHILLGPLSCLCVCLFGFFFVCLVVSFCLSYLTPCYLTSILLQPHLPGASTTQGVTALYDVSDDWTPIYDKSSIPGYYMAIGTSGNQFKNAGVVGALMSSLIDHVESGNPHDAEPLQWKMQRTGMMLDTSKFSRLREPLATSGTVMG